MTSSLAVEWAKGGIRVNTISPGYMMTKMTATALEKNPRLKVCLSRTIDPNSMSSPGIMECDDPNGQSESSNIAFKCGADGA